MVDGSGSAHRRVGGDPRRRRRRWLASTASAGLVLLGLATVPITAGAAPRPVAADAGGTAGGVQYSPNTVVIPAATIASELVSVSPDGSTYTFKSAVGPLAELKTGSVMLLTGLAVRDVTGTTHSSGHLVVMSRPAAITDLITNGTLAWNEPVDFADGFALGGAAVPPETSAARVEGTRASVGALFGLHSIAGGGVTLKGKTDSYSYAVTFKQAGSAVSVSVTLSKSSPIDMSVTISGTLGNLRSSGKIAVAKSKLAGMRMLANGLNGQFDLSYSAKPLSAFGLGTAGGIKITIPAELVVPLEVGGVPLFVGIKVAFFASVGFSGYNQAISGTYSVSYDGNGGFSTSSSGATTAAGVAQGLGKVLLDAANAVRTGPLSFIFGAQVPQLELGLGVKGLNVGGFVSLIASTGIATTGSSCDTRELLVQGSAGAEASFFGLSASLGSATLFTKQIDAAYPVGCGVFPGA